MDKNTKEQFFHFLKKRGADHLYRGYVKTYNHGQNVDEFLDNVQPIDALAKAFEWDKIPQLAGLDFNQVALKWEMTCIKSRLGEELKNLIKEFGENVIEARIQDMRNNKKWYLYSFDYLNQLEEEKDKPNKQVTAHLVQVKPKPITPMSKAINSGDDDFEFIQFKKTSAKVDLDDYTIKVKNGKKNNYISFNAHISALISEYGHYYVRVRRDKVTNEVHFIFQNTETTDSLKCISKGRDKMCLNSKAVVEWLLSYVGAEGEDILVQVSKNKAPDASKCITIQIIGKK